MCALAIPKPFEPTSRAFLAYLRVECGLAANTLDAYARDLRDLFCELASGGVTSISAIGPRELAVHIAALRTQRGLSATSVARHLATIRMLFRFLIAGGEIDDDPTEYVLDHG